MIDAYFCGEGLWCLSIEKFETFLLGMWLSTRVCNCKGCKLDSIISETSFLPKRLATSSHTHTACDLKAILRIQILLSSSWPCVSSWQGDLSTPNRPMRPRRSRCSRLGRLRLDQSSSRHAKWLRMGGGATAISTLTCPRTCGPEVCVKTGGNNRCRNFSWSQAFQRERWHWFKGGNSEWRWSGALKMPIAASRSHIPRGLKAPVPHVQFVKSIGLPLLWFHVAMWFAGIVIVASSFANAPCVVGPSLQPPMASLWIEASTVASDDIGWAEEILIGSYLCLRAKIETILQFRRVFEMSSCSWLAWFRRELLQDACIARCLTFSTDGISQWYTNCNFCFNVTSPNSKNHVEFWMSASWSDPFRVVSVHFQMWKRTLSTFPLLPPSVCNATRVHCGACADITSHTIARWKRRVFALCSFGRLIPFSSKPKSGFVAFWCRNDDSDKDDVWKEMLQLKTGLSKNPKPHVSCSWRKGVMCSLNKAGHPYWKELVFLDRLMWNHLDSDKTQEFADDNPRKHIIFCITAHIRTSWFSWV